MTERQAALTSYREYRLRLEGHEKEVRERMEVARWSCFMIYCQNPYIKPPKAQTVISYYRFPWENEDLDGEVTKENCHVSEEEQAKLDKIFNEVYGGRV